VSRIFLSHSSTNNAEAVALRDWLADNGWKDEVFLDLDPQRGIAAGERWEAYGRPYGDGPPQWKKWFNSGLVNLLQAPAKHREWSTEIEARIANIRA